MILYHAASSYYSMIARLALIEAGVPFDGRVMDIHLAKEQLADWYVAINPNMTVPALVDGDRRLDDSADILAFAAGRAGARWLAPDDATRQRIATVIAGHYAIPIERLTFTRLMTRLPPLRLLFPRMLARAAADLERRAATAPDGDALRAKARVNRDRITYFTTGAPLAEKLAAERRHVAGYLATVPAPVADGLLFGAAPCAADIVVAVLLARLRMSGEWDLLAPRPDLAAWFDRMQARPAFAAADIWTRWQVGRILRRR